MSHAARRIFKNSTLDLITSHGVENSFPAAMSTTHAFSHLKVTRTIHNHALRHMDPGSSICTIWNLDMVFNLSFMSIKFSSLTGTYS